MASHSIPPSNDAGTPSVSVSHAESASATDHANQSIEDPPYVPPPMLEGRMRTLILCFDGTGDKFDADVRDRLPLILGFLDEESHFLLLSRHALVKNSNIIQLFSMLKKDDREQQMCYYQPGVGTYVDASKGLPLAATTSKMLDQALAFDLDSHVTDGYAFLMQNFKANDHICIFGFSRGAYTARALAGMIHKVGLLPAWNHEQIPFAYKMYTDTSELGWKQSNAFKRTFSVDVQIDFIGVWDTVSSVGLYPRTLPFTTSNTIVRTFRHALALDERRSKFQPNHWNRPNAVEEALGKEAEGAGGVEKPKGRLHKYRSFPDIRRFKDNPEASNNTPERATRSALYILSQEQLESENSERRDMPTDVEEVWFAGAHCDVGGGSVKNGTPYALARISLRWMVRECFKANTGIVFISSALRDLGLDPLTVYPTVLPRPPPLSSRSIEIRGMPKDTRVRRRLSSLVGSRPVQDPRSSRNTSRIDLASLAMSEEEHEVFDATSPIYDRLSLSPAWWSLELLPVQLRRQMEDDSWREEYRINLGRGREVLVPAITAGGDEKSPGMVRVHRSVRMRMCAAGEAGGYTPKASLGKLMEEGKILWVD